ncbi:MAG: ribosome small subunit-dependent GTPase A [Raoultibacter sp.]|jgi:ribosome biogenesis GTPase
MVRGRVIKLDRGFPLVLTQDGKKYRCKHATALVKEQQQRAVIGDWVELDIPEGHDKAIIESIVDRRNSLVRKDPAEQTLSQVLAVNFDIVFIAQPLSDINLRRLERELVIAHETGAEVIILLTKADLACNEAEVEATVARVQELLNDEILLVVSSEDAASIEAVRRHLPENKIAVLIGKSGVGKSSLVNLLVGEEIQDTMAVRETDGRGRHTTVSREMIEIPSGGAIIDMPGVRGLGLWDADTGLETAFADIEELAQQCKFRDCRHGEEPGCKVREAFEDGVLSEARLSSYRALKQETEDIKERRRENAHAQKRAVRGSRTTVHRKQK